MDNGPSAFTGRERKRKTRPAIKVIDRASRAIITVGGIGTILAVILILVFLVWVVAPLFSGAEVDGAGSHARGSADDVRPLRVGIDEHRILMWSLHADGVIRLRRVDDGETLATRKLEGTEDARITCVSVPASEETLALGLDSGQVLTGRIWFRTDFYEPTDEGVPAELVDLEVGTVGRWDESLVQRTPAGQLRRQSLVVDVNPPFVPQGGTRILAVDYKSAEKSELTIALTEDGTIHLERIRLRPNHMTGEVTRKRKSTRARVVSPDGMGPPAWIVLSGLGDNAYTLWPDGHLVRMSLPRREVPVEVERISGLGRDSARLTTVAALVGRSSILLGDDRGHVRSWFLAPSPTRETADNMSLVAAREFDGEQGVTSLAPSPRGKIVAIGDASGLIRLFHVTSGKLLCEVEVSDGKAVEALTISPGENLITAMTEETVAHWDLDVGYPEASVGALFTPVLYEGHAEPRHEWQSSGASDSFEPKLGLVPLIFGTLKATLYSMLFAVPLALLAAIYTSEFLSPKVRPRIKSVVEVMASLPSVVLGFLAAFVLAPFIERVVPAVLLTFFTLPFAFAVAAHVWQLLPRPVTLRFERFRLGFILLVLPIGVGLAFLFGPLVESLFFGGDIKKWLDGQIGPAGTGWALMLLPLCVIFAAFVFGRLFGGRVRGMDEREAALFSVVRVAAVCFGGLLLAFLLGTALQIVGADPRPGVMATYVQRNAMVVGIAMGFAVIPIIYTIAEDALSSVPEHLRAASLGSGATPWQTAIRVIVPTAASGLFSACMIGLGRAVGETMIVLMAAGNTALMEWNPFNGFRTLSANIAVEMPEAVKDSTHYRLLFLAGLILFLMTFVVNTIAEVVRLRFRKRAFQL